MTTEDPNAPTGAPPVVPGETIATEMASRPEGEVSPLSETADAPPADAGADAAPAESEPSAEATAEAEPKKPGKPALTWQEKRRIEETNKRRLTEAENVKLKERIALLEKGAAPAPATTDAPPAQPATLTPDQAKAAARAELAAEAAAQAFTEATGRVLAAGIEHIPGFEEARVEMVNNFGDQLNARPDFFEAITSLENGHEVFYELAKDPERTERFLSMTPVRLAVEIAKLGTKAPAEPAVRPISKAPAPVKPVGGTPQNTSRLDDPNISMDEFAKSYLKQMADKGR